MSLLNATKKRSKTVRLHIADLIEEAILSGEIRPGDEVPQLKLSKEWGVSQPSIREALQELEYRGLVVKKGRGRTVTDFSEQDLGNMFQVRAVLEPFACRLAAYAWTQQLGDALEACLVAMKEGSDQRNDREYIRRDLEFHRTIWRGQPNRQLEAQLNMLCVPLFAYELVRRSGSGSVPYQWNLRQSRIILNVLQTRDGEKAERLVRHIIERFRRRDLSDYRRIKESQDQLSESADNSVEVRANPALRVETIVPE
jgi:DNA-binding GntR family transcriptional regulator